MRTVINWTKLTVIIMGDDDDYDYGDGGSDSDNDDDDVL